MNTTATGGCFSFKSFFYFILIILLLSACGKSTDDTGDNIDQDPALLASASDQLASTQSDEKTSSSDESQATGNDPSLFRREERDSSDNERTSSNDRRTSENGSGTRNSRNEDDNERTSNNDRRGTENQTTTGDSENDDDDDEESVAVNPPPVVRNQAPDGSIVLPDRTTVISRGESVAFSASAVDPDFNLPISYLWKIPGRSDIQGQTTPPVSFNQAGQFTIQLIVTDSIGLQDPTPATRLIIVQENVINNLPPEGAILSPAQNNVTINVGETLYLAAEGNDPDGNLPLQYNWNFNGAAPNIINQTPGAIGFFVPGTFNVVMTIQDSSGAVDPTPDSFILNVVNTNGGGNPPPILNTSHAGRFTVYEGSKTCIGCHETQVHEVHNSVHYQWQGNTPYVTNMTHGGKLGGINDFCGYPDTNFLGILTNVDGKKVDGGCATCHIGMGSKPSPTISAVQLENIDCLVCHSDTYQRKVVQQTDGAVRFAPAEEKMSVSVLQAITDIHKTPSSGSCVNCHSYAGGGCNNKRGDLEEAHRNVTDPNFDVHMAPKSAGGAGLSCLSCHTAQNHKIAGRGVDLRPTDLDVPVKCTNCHNSQPHNDSQLNMHTAKVDCATCHIPHFAKIVSTDMLRDYSKPAVLNQETRLYEPNIQRQAQVVPEYKFFNGLSTIYEFGTAAVVGSNGRVPMASPSGNRADGKIYPFKRHQAVLPIDPQSQRIIPMKMSILFQTADVNQSILQGASDVGWNLSNGYNFVGAERYMGIYHEVSPANQALACNACHGGNRLDFAALGYTPKTTRNGRPLCSSCHGSESSSFTSVHSRHVDRQGIACTECHNF